MELLPLLLPPVLAPTLLAGCSDRCVDGDGDGFGLGCAAGLDCDDRDRSRQVGCVDPCEADPQSRGCPCQGRQSLPCFTGPMASVALGECLAGEQACEWGVWSSCRNERTPAAEHCDGLDNDCDGTVDEYVESPCGACGRCEGEVWGGLSAPFSVTDPGIDPELTVRDGRLALAFAEVPSSHVWIANTAEQTVSHIHADTLEEDARQVVAGFPMRVAVDYSGGAYVLGADGNGTYLSRLADATRCEAQRPAGQLGPEEPGACLLWSRKVGVSNAGALALVVDGSAPLDGELTGDAWVGMARPPRLLRVSAKDGQTLEEIPLEDGAQPHDAAFAPDGTLWVADRSGSLLRLARRAGATYALHSYPLPGSCDGVEAVAIDAQGDVLGTTAGCEYVFRFAPTTMGAEAWSFGSAPGLLTTRSLELLGSDLFVSHAAPVLSRVSAQSLEFLETAQLGGLAIEPLHSGPMARLGGGGPLFVVSRSHGSEELGLLTRLDPTTLEVTGRAVVGRGPMAMGDFAGGRVAGRLHASGEARHRFRGCSGGRTHYVRIHAAVVGRGPWELQVDLRAERAGPLEVESFQHVLTAYAESGPPDAGVQHLVQDLHEVAPSEGTAEVRLHLGAGSLVTGPEVVSVGIEYRCDELL